MHQTAVCQRGKLRQRIQLLRNPFYKHDQVYLCSSRHREFLCQSVKGNMLLLTLTNDLPLERDNTNTIMQILGFLYSLPRQHASSRFALTVIIS
jgi:hypothetical protein